MCSADVLGADVLRHGFDLAVVLHRDDRGRIQITPLVEFYSTHEPTSPQYPPLVENPWPLVENP